MPRRGTSTASRFCGSTKTCSPDETPSRSGAGPSSAPGADEHDQGDPKLNDDAEPEGTDGGDPGDAARQVGVAHAAEDDDGGEAGTGGDGRRLLRAGIRPPHGAPDRFFRGALPTGRVRGGKPVDVCRGGAL